MNISNKALIAVIAGILILAGATWYLTRSRDVGGSQVVVTIDGQLFGTYSLNKDQVIEIKPQDQSWHNTLQIQNRTASIIDSDCSNQVCVLTPALEEDMLGIIVCLPHGVIVELQEG